MIALLACVDGGIICVPVALACAPIVAIAVVIHHVTKNKEVQCAQGQ